jgi:IS5 family transposase
MGPKSVDTCPISLTKEGALPPYQEPLQKAASVISFKNRTGCPCVVLGVDHSSLFMKRVSQLSFSDVERSARRSNRTSERLRKFNAAINWPMLEALLPGKDHLTEAQRRRGGRPRYPETMMLRILILQFLYDLSDPQLEDELLDKASFQEFAQLSGTDPIPDFTTVWRFKESLIEADTLTKIFASLQSELHRQGLMLKQGKIVDATMIPTSFTDPLKKSEREEIERVITNKAEGWQKTSRYFDLEARSTSKVDSKGRPTWFYGYKMHTAVDAGSKLIECVVVTSANVADISMYPELVSADDRAIYGDRGYQKRTHRKEAEARGQAYNVMRKADKHHPLSADDAEFNKRIAPIRIQVEHVFARMKTMFSLRRTPVRGLRRTTFRCLMNVILYNIERSIHLLSKQAAPIGL